MLITNYLQPVMRTGFNVLAVLAGLGVQGGDRHHGGLRAHLAGRHGLSLGRARARRRRHGAPWRESRALFKQAPPMALNLFAYTAMRSVDVLIVGAMLPAARVGEYAVVSNLSALVPVAAALSQTLGPTVARHHQAGNPAGIRDAINQYIRSATVLASFVFAGIAGFGRHIDLIFGPAYQPGEAMLALIPLGYLVSATLAPTGYALTMCGKAGTELALLCVSLAVLVAGCVAGAQQWGAAGAAGAVLVAFIVGDAARLVAVSRSLGGADRALAGSGAAGGGLFAGMGVQPAAGARASGFVQLVAGCVAYAALYAGAMLAARAVLRSAEAAR
jgi:O-antigen/teichoic acid export membrane protein